MSAAPQSGTFSAHAARRGLCLVIAAPSGAGKSTIAAALRDAEPELVNSVSVTTRPRRPGEQDGVHYHYRSAAEFDAMVADGALLEWAHVFGHSYGTPRAPVERALAEGRDVVFDIDWQGHRLLRSALPRDVVGAFVLPPSLDALEARLRGRGGDAADEIARRMGAARSELSHWAEFDHLVVNEDLADAIADMRAILRAARLSSARRPGIAALMRRLDV